MATAMEGDGDGCVCGGEGNVLTCPRSIDMDRQLARELGTLSRGETCREGGNWSERATAKAAARGSSADGTTRVLQRVTRTRGRRAAEPTPHAGKERGRAKSRGRCVCEARPGGSLVGRAGRPCVKRRGLWGAWLRAPALHRPRRHKKHSQVPEIDRH